MKPFKYKNKISFGDFKSSVEAARAVDAAFFYYGKNKWCNFRDSPAFLKPLPVPLPEAAKLKFVKEQARLLAIRAPHLPSSWEPAKRSEQVKIKTPIQPASDIPATPTCNPNDEDRFEALPGDALDTHLRSCVGERASTWGVQTPIRSDPVPLEEDEYSQEILQPLPKTLSASAASVLEMFPEIPEVGEELRPLDVDDYAIDELHIVGGEHWSVSGSVFMLQ